MNVSDEELIQRLLQNDEEAILFCFYQKYWNTFQYHIYKLFPYQVEIQAFVHEFFLYLFENNWKRLRTYNFSSSLNTWISVVSFRFFKKYKDVKIDFNGIITIKEEWDNETMSMVRNSDNMLQIDVLKAIETIKNERDQKIATRLLLEDADPKEVAVEFNITIDYLYTVKNRIIKQLRVSLKAYRL